MSADRGSVAAFTYRSASIELAARDPSLLDGIRFLYRAFRPPASPSPWRYDVESAGGPLRISLHGELVHAATDESDAVRALDWCVSSHLLGDVRPGVVVLHAAGLQMPAGGTLLLVAPSGGGKSTLAVALLARGAALLSDELVPIDPRDLRPLAYPRAVGLKNESTVPPEVVSGERRTRSATASVRWLQAVRVLPPATAADAVAAVVFCQHEPAGPTRLSPIPRRQALAHLLAQAPMLAEDRETGFAALAALADQAPCYHLTHADARAAAEQLLSRTAARRAPRGLVIENYVRLLTETPRLEAMERALRAVVRPGEVVVDVGTGTGAFALFAARAGARRVFALDREDIAAVAREMAHVNGLADVVTVVQAEADRWSPPEPVDVVVFEDIEDVGIGPAVGTMLARLKTFLRPGGRFVPSLITTWMAPAESPSLHAKVGQWPEDRAFGLDFSPLLRLARETRSHDWLGADTLLAPGQRLFTHELGTPLPAGGHAEATFTATRAGALHGLVVWFDQLLAPGVTWSNAPGPRETLWGQAFLQTPDAAEVRTGDEVKIAVAYAPWGPHAQTWSWTVTVSAPDGALRHREARSTFRSLPMTAAQLRRRSLDHHLAPGPHAALMRDALALFDGTRDLRQIAAEVSRRHPGALHEGDDGARQLLEALLPLAAPE